MKDSSMTLEAVRENLHHIGRRQWGMWSATVAVLLLLTLGVASFAFPGLLTSEQNTYSFYLNQSVRSLVGLVLVFSVYLIYQQLLLTRVRRQVAEQVDSLAKVESLATEVYKLAALDQLTGLYNRRSGEQRLAQEISRAERHGRALTLLLLDLDGLKQVNDKSGHAAGDLMLKTFAERVQKAIRGSDLAARIGGDEFMVVLPECKVEEVRHVLSRLDGLCVEINGERMSCRFSRGWTDFRSGDTTHDLMKRADELLYENKRAGKENAASLSPNKLEQALS
ncbi:MAG TPA: GGDEF domain-containing protein [Verrucomicrobiae bacterium]|nr:GGDEF domain-containing protein [Verrucomicrobiae bacterium]